MKPPENKIGMAGIGVEGYNQSMIFRLLFVIGLSGLAAAGELPQREVKFALYSAAWGENAIDDLRLVARNDTADGIRLDSITFLKDGSPDARIELDLGLEVPAMGYAELRLGYADLLQHNECIERTLAANWRLAEISNYTLNPSVRNLIIENTDSFRIYQCVESVVTRWTGLNDQSLIEQEEWVLFHFESRNLP